MPYHDVIVSHDGPGIACGHLADTPTASPCRTCPHKYQDKNKPPCEGCEELAPFQVRQANLVIDRKEEIGQARPRNASPAGTRPRMARLPEDAVCSLCHERPAVASHFRHLFDGLLCNRCYQRLLSRYRRLGSISLPEKPGEL